MPDTPVAAPPAPPAAPAAAPSAPAPVVPSAPAPPAAPAPVPATPAKFDPTTSATAPSAGDYPQTVDGNDQFMADNGAWLLAHPAEANKQHIDRLKSEDTAFRPAEETPEAAAEVPATEPDKPADGAKPAEAVAATPAVIEEWTGKSPELKAAFDSNPELRTAVMEMARFNESAKPVLDIVGTPEEAQFAVEHANRLVSIQSSWMLAGEDPEMIEPAWNQVADMFKSRDANGNEVKDAGGNIQFDSDFKPFVRKAGSTAISEFSDSTKAQIGALKQKLQGVYPNDEAKEADQESLKQLEYDQAAFDFVLARLAQPDDRPALPTLPPNATEEQKAFQKKLEEQSRDLDTKAGKTSTAERKAARAKLDTDVDREWSGSISTRIDTHIKAMQDRGEYLPAFVLTDKWINPRTQQATNVSDLGMRVYMGVNAKIYGNPIHKAKLAQLQAMGVTGKEARVAELNRLTTLYLPKVLDARIADIQNGIRATQQPKPPGTVPATGATPGTPRLEPNSAGTVMPKAHTDNQMMDWAREEARKSPEYTSASPRDREEIVMQFYAKKKYGAQ